MTKKDVIAAMAEKSGLQKAIARSALDALIEVVTEALKNGDRVEIRGFGTFLMKERASRKARNPKTGKEIKVPARLVPAFKPGKELKEATVKELSAKTRKRGKKK